MTPKFVGVKCHSSTTVKGTDFKFNKRVPWDSPDESFSSQGTCLSNMKSVSLTVVEQLAFNAQKFGVM